MREVKGNCWDMINRDAICVLTNCQVDPSGQLVMGGGQAREAKERVPLLPVAFGVGVRATEGHVFCVDTEQEGSVVFFATKDHWREPSDLNLIKRSCEELMVICDERGWKDVVLPRPGCGLGGLRWEDVKPVIEEILDDRVRVVTWA